MMAVAEDHSNELSEKGPVKALVLSEDKTTESETADDNCPSSIPVTSPPEHVEPTVLPTETVSKVGEDSSTSHQNSTSPNKDTEMSATTDTTEKCADSLFDESELSETNVVLNSPASDSKLSVNFNSDRDDLLGFLEPVEMTISYTDGESIKNGISDQTENERLAAEDVSEDQDKDPDDPMAFTEENENELILDEPRFSQRILRPVINCVPQSLPEHVEKHFKTDGPHDTRKRKLSKKTYSSKQRKVSDSSKPDITSAEAPYLITDDTPVGAESSMVDKSTELDKSDKFYDIKRILLQATRESSGVNLKRYRLFSNIFLKNWRYSKQLSSNTNARGKQVIDNTLKRIVKDLYEHHLIKVKGPVHNVDVIKMLTEEVMQDNSRMFSQTPPSLTVLITSELFDRHFTGGVREPLPVPGQSVSKRGGVRPLNLGSSTNQWLKLKDELGMETNSEVASILIHCYKAWISVACSKCRRHMEVGMEQKSGRSIANSETSVCIVSCDCGKSTSGGFMIECDVCHKWQHGFCVNVDKDNIPDSYSCSWCRKIRGKVELSEKNKGDDSDDSVVSIDNTKLCSTDDSEPEIIELD